MLASLLFANTQSQWLSLAVQSNMGYPFEVGLHLCALFKHLSPIHSPGDL